MKIAILGAGCVGLNTAAAWLGHDVRVIDKDRQRPALLAVAEECGDSLLPVAAPPIGQRLPPSPAVPT